MDTRTRLETIETAIFLKEEEGWRVAPFTTLDRFSKMTCPLGAVALVDNHSVSHIKAIDEAARLLEVEHWWAAGFINGFDTEGEHIIDGILDIWHEYESFCDGFWLGRHFREVWREERTKASD